MWMWISFGLICWLLCGVGYLVLNMSRQFKRNNATAATMPPQVWWEYIIMLPLLIVFLLLCLLYEGGLTMIWAITFGKVDLGQ